VTVERSVVEPPDEAEAVVRIVLVDDHPVWRDGVRADLERLGAAVTIGEAGDGADAVVTVRETMPDVVLMDLTLPKMDGIEATHHIVEESPHVKILVVSASAEEQDVLEAIKAGAMGYVLKSATPAEIAGAVKRTAAGEPVFTPSLAGLVLSEFRRVAAKQAGDPALTPRENEVLILVAKGYTYREIARKLFIAVKTVQNHVQNILRKLQLQRRYELMRYAIERGYNRLPEPE
jgi:DNA-binding NarL/FixJ family response regulator